MASHALPFWKEAPFIRLLIPFSAGIVVQWYISMPQLPLKIIIAACLILFLFFSGVKMFSRFRYYWFTGMLVNTIYFCLGAMLTIYKDVRSESGRSVESLLNNSAMVISLEEPLSEKANSVKARAKVNLVFTGDSFHNACEQIIVYFDKTTKIADLRYGSQLIISRPLTPIRNMGNPGGFDYQQFCALQGIYYQVYLKNKDFTAVTGNTGNRLNQQLFSWRKNVVDLMKKYVPGKKESGMAEALLIGYKDDLDRDLVQSYSNTGVVHIIAISGLHVGLIYWIFNLLLKPVGRIRRMQWLKAVLVIAGLWLFGLLAGGSASVLRSALMFSFIVIGQHTGRKTYTINSLAASAFLLLCFNPFWLWDAGFQLSYTAVLSIVIFMKPVYGCLAVSNKLLDNIWKATTLSFSAQILTTPLSIFSFSQFPNYFLITNLVAVPLSGVILFAELLLCTISWNIIIADFAGNAVSWLIRMMNDFVEHINQLPFAVWGQLHFSLFQLIAAYFAITFFSTWIFFKRRPSFILFLCCICCILSVRTISMMQHKQQRKLIVYNFPHQQAIELVNSSQVYFIGDIRMISDPLVNSQYFNPAHASLRVNSAATFPVYRYGNSLYFGDHTFLLINGPFHSDSNWVALKADYIIMSGNAAISIEDVINHVECSYFIFDSSNGPFKISRWQKECSKLGFSSFSVPAAGAFILNLN